jgi:uncharacterized membrane protein
MTDVGQEQADAELAVRAIAGERLTFFADAVIAIAVTLLALDLPKPTGDTNSALLRSAFDQRSAFMAFAISFVVIAAHWRGHHRVFRYVTHADSRLSGLTLGWLFLQVITPFATAVITGDGAFQVRFGFYAIIQITAFVLFGLMVREIDTKHLYRADTPPGLFASVYARSANIGTGFLVSIPVSFFTGYSYVCWFAVPMLISFVRRTLVRRRA